MAEGRFGWYESVRVATADPAKAAIDGHLGAVAGRAEGGGGWSYAVFIYRQGRVWPCEEPELAPTGQFDRCEALFGEGRGPVHGGAVMQEQELAVGDSLDIPGAGTLVVKDVEGDAALIGLDLLDRAEEARLREQAEGAR